MFLITLSTVQHFALQSSTDNYYRIGILQLTMTILLFIILPLMAYGGKNEQ